MDTYTHTLTHSLSLSLSRKSAAAHFFSFFPPLHLKTLVMALSTRLSCSSGTLFLIRHMFLFHSSLYVEVGRMRCV
jgi:hypothetical protein